MTPEPNVVPSASESSTSELSSLNSFVPANTNGWSQTRSSSTRPWASRDLTTSRCRTRGCRRPSLLEGRDFIGEVAGDRRRRREPYGCKLFIGRHASSLVEVVVEANTERPAPHETRTRTKIRRSVSPVLRPEVSYARASDGVSVAFAAMGDGPVAVVLVPPLVSQIDLMWEEPAFERFMTSLAAGARVIVLDRRGSGPSDHV